MFKETLTFGEALRGRNLPCRTLLSYAHHFLQVRQSISNTKNSNNNNNKTKTGIAEGSSRPTLTAHEVAQLLEDDDDSGEYSTQGVMMS